MTTPPPPLAWLRCPRCESVPERYSVTERADHVEGERWRAIIGCRTCHARGDGVYLSGTGSTAEAAEGAARLRWSQRWPESDEAVDHHREDMRRHHDEVANGLVREGWDK